MLHIYSWVYTDHLYFLLGDLPFRVRKEDFNPINVFYSSTMDEGSKWCKIMGLKFAYTEFVPYFINIIYMGVAG